MLKIASAAISKSFSVLCGHSSVASALSSPVLSPCPLSSCHRPRQTAYRHGPSAFGTSLRNMRIKCHREIFTRSFDRLRNNCLVDLPPPHFPSLPCHRERNPRVLQAPLRVCCFCPPGGLLLPALLLFPLCIWILCSTVLMALGICRGCCMWIYTCFKIRAQTQNVLRVGAGAARSARGGVVQISVPAQLRLRRPVQNNPDVETGALGPASVPGSAGPSWP